MTCEFLSGVTQLLLTSASVTTGDGSIAAGTYYFFLTGRNRAGWTISSPPLVVTVPSNSSMTISLPPEARGLGTDFHRYALSINTVNNPATSVQIGEWENYLIDQITRRALDPIVLFTPEHIALAPSVAVPDDLPPTGINGMHRLVIGGLPGNAPSSYYKYSRYEARPSTGADIIEVAGNKWVRVANPYTAQITDPAGVGGCAAPVGAIDNSYVLPPLPYNPNQVNPTKGTPVKLVWRNGSSLPLKAGTNFGIEVRQGRENQTDAFNGKLIVTLKGYTDGLGGLDRSDGLGGFLPFVDVDRVWSFDDDALGIMTLDKDLPPGECVVWEIAPYFTAQQFQGNLAAGELISIYVYPYSQSGKNVSGLWSLTGDLVLPVGERLHVLPSSGAAVEVKGGSAIVKGFIFSEVREQSVLGLVPNTPDQKICIDGNGVASLRSQPLGSEAVLSLVSTVAGTGRLGTLSPAVNIAANGRAILTLNYPNVDADGIGNIRQDYPVLGLDEAVFNPPEVRIFAVKSGIYYPAILGGTARIIPGANQQFVVTGLGAAIAMPVSSSDLLFDLFEPPTVVGSAATGGTIAVGSYQFFACYYYDGTTVSKIDRGHYTCLREATRGIADLFLLNEGWGTPIGVLADLRSIPRSDTFSWQHRPLPSNKVAVYDPTSTAVDNGITSFKPTWNNGSGRWLVAEFGLLGRIFNPRGEYDNAASYQPFDLVFYTDASYIAIANTSGNLPTDTSKWQKLFGLQPSGGGGSGVGLEPWQLVSSSIDLVAKGRYQLDLSNRLTLRLPIAPIAGDEIELHQVKGNMWADIDTRGAKFKGVSDPNCFYQSLDRVGDRLVFVSSDIGWICTSNIIDLFVEVVEISQIVELHSY